MTVALEIAGLAAAMALVHEAFRRAGALAGWLAFAVLPLALTPHWMAVRYHVELFPHSPVFPIVKLHTMLLCACIATALRYTRLHRLPGALQVVYWLVVVNMAEAVMRDLAVDDAAHRLNAAAGGLLIFLLPNRPARLTKCAGNVGRDLRWSGTSRTWIGCYTLWNAVFVYLNYPEHCGRQLAVLVAAAAIGMVYPDRWLQARAYTLATSVLVLFALPSFTLSVADTTHWNNAATGVIGAALSFSAAAVSAAAIVARRRRGELPSFRYAKNVMLNG